MNRQLRKNARIGTYVQHTESGLIGVTKTKPLQNIVHVQLEGTIKIVEINDLITLTDEEVKNDRFYDDNRYRNMPIMLFLRKLFGY